MPCRSSCSGLPRQHKHSHCITPRMKDIGSTQPQVTPVLEGILQMPFRVPRSLALLLISAVTMAGSTSAFADQPSPSLYERRLGIIKGTSKGIVLWEPDKPEPSAATTPTNSNVEISNDGKPVAAAQSAPDTSKFLSKLPPASGRSMANASRLGAPGGGIPVPTANRASPSEAEPAKKP